MIHLLAGALLSLGLMLFALSPVGGRVLARRLDDGGRIRAVLAAVGALLLTGNLAALLLGLPGHLADLVASVTLVVHAVVAVAVLRTSLHRRPADPVITRVLAVGAHPDDLELACGGTLAKLADSGCEVHALIMSRGQVGGDEEVRLQEAHAGAAYLGVRHVEVLDHPDTRLSEASNAMVADIETRIRALRPDLILTHAEHDQHQDHHAVHLAMLRAARRHPSILCFESPSVTRSFNPSVYVDIGRYVHVKIRAVQQHRDQKGKPYMTGEKVRAVAAFRGNQARTRYAEGFEPVRMLASVTDQHGTDQRASDPGPVSGAPSAQGAPA